MASINKVLLIIVFCCLYTFSNSLNVFKQYQKPSDCKENADYFQYFSTSVMECKNCPEKKTSQKTTADGYGCECLTGYRYVFNFGGDNVTCEKCGANQVRSMDGFNCVDCTSATNCDSCPAGKLPFEREVNGAWNGGSTKQRTCVDCVSNTSLNAAGDRCERCSSFLALTPLSNCQCSGLNYYESGGVCLNAPKPTTLNYDLPLLDSTILSSYLEDNLLAAYSMCSIAKNTTACQILGNMCVLTYYEYKQYDPSPSYQPDSACNMFKKITGDLGLEWPYFMPWLLYATSGREATLGDIVLADNTFTTGYTITPLSYLKFVVARYNLGGEFLGFSNVTNGLLQLCTDTSERLDALYTFGTSYSQTCNIKAIDLWDTTKYPMEFFDMYIEFEDNGETQLYAVPIKINNLVYNNREVNTEGDTRNLILARRFFLIDNVAATDATSTSTSNIPTYVRYLKTLQIVIRLDDSKSDGRIYPPYLDLTYDAVSLTTAQDGGLIQPYVYVTYSFSQEEYRRNFRIAIGTLSVLAVLYAAYRSWVWSKRAGRLGMDFVSIASFIFYASGSLANIFFVVSFGIAFYFLVFFKRQTAVIVFHIDGIQYEEWLALFASAFALKSLHVIHMIYIHCTVDLFLIDWERPRSGAQKNPDSTKKVESNPVSIWRTYFVANEWNEIQTTRKINHIFQIFATIFFLVVVGFQNVATKDPDGNVVKSASSYQAPHSVMFRYAVSACIYLLVAFVQWVFFTFIYERFVEDKVRQFIDLCSMSNISVFVMAHAQFGYYIHGRSVHGKADTSMKEMFDMMKREEEDLCGQRGLLPGTEHQTFVMSLPRKLRLKYEQVMLPVALEGPGGTGAGQGKTSEKQVEAYTIINKFLSAFVDHSLKDLDYVVKDKTLLESIMDTEFLDTTEKGIFFNDNGHAFDEVLFYGNEGILIIFETLLFCIIDLICTNFVLSGIITYIVIEIIALVRDSGGRKNLARKTLVDQRFLI